MKPKADARICDHKCDRLAVGECVICEQDTCFDHGARPTMHLNRGGGRETKFMIELVVCQRCIEQMEEASITSVAASMAASSEAHKEPEIVATLREGGVKIFEGVKALLAKKALQKERGGRADARF